MRDTASALNISGKPGWQIYNRMQPTFQRFPQVGRGTEANPDSFCICVFVFVHKYDDIMGLPPCLAPAEENVERLAAFYYSDSPLVYILLLALIPLPG